MIKNVKDIFAPGASANVFISDGGCGSELIKRGLKIGDCSEEWNVSHRDKVMEVASAYVEAGADIILTNTFGGTRYIQQKHGFENRVAEFNKAAVLIAKEAAKNRALVFASVGPTGKMISMGELSAEDAYAAFKEQVVALKGEGVDGIVVETMSDLEEFRVALKAARESGLPVVGSMSFDSGKEFDRTMMGASIQETAAVAEEMGIQMVGANCGVGIENYVKIAANILKATKLPVWIKANAGLPVIEDGRTVYKMEPHVFGHYALELKKLGVRVIGGCCGTTPAHIAGIRKAFQFKV